MDDESLGRIFNELDAYIDGSEVAAEAVEDLTNNLNEEEEEEEDWVLLLTWLVSVYYYLRSFSISCWVLLPLSSLFLLLLDLLLPFSTLLLLLLFLAFKEALPIY